MKRTIFYVAAVAIMALVFASCEREDNELTTPDGGNDTTSQDTPTPSVPGEWVDLGLPSGLLWYSCNLGAITPEGRGDYYAWGETQTKSTYSWGNYIHGDCEIDGYDQIYSLYKYNVDPHYGTVDNLITLQACDDAATARLGNGARIPTKEDYEELERNTRYEWTTQNGINGRIYRSSNGNSIFLPAAGSRGTTTSVLSANYYGRYWLSTLDTTGWTDTWSDTVPQYYKDCYCAHAVEFNSCGDIRASGGNMLSTRETGRSIRPVKSGNKK